MTGFCVFRSVMANSGGEDEDWGEGSGDEEEIEEGDDDLMEVQSSGSRDSVKPILCLSERNEEDTVWTLDDGTKAARSKNKLKSEDMATIRKRKTLMWTEVDKNPLVEGPNQTCYMGQNCPGLPTERQVFAPLQTRTTKRVQPLGLCPKRIPHYGFAVLGNAIDSGMGLSITIVNRRCLSTVG